MVVSMVARATSSVVRKPREMNAVACLVHFLLFSFLFSLEPQCMGCHDPIVRVDLLSSVKPLWASKDMSRCVS